MHNMIGPLAYSLSIFWGYRLLKRSASFANLCVKLLLGLLGLAFVEGTWIVESLKLPAGFLLAGVVPAMILELILNSPSGKPLFKSMTFDDKVLWGFIPVTGVFCLIRFLGNP